MKHLFVPYNLAVLAKNKGFDEYCLYFYNELHYPGELLENINGSYNSDYPNDGHIIMAPLYQQLIDWFRDKYDYIIWVEKDYNGYFYKVQIPPGTHESGYFDSYYFCLDTAFEEAFKLI